MEAFGTDHKKRIIKALKDTGFQPKLKDSKGVF
jgi:threonine dehydratase